MFGKPEWFVEKKWGWGLNPVTWQGWAYVGTWVTVMVVPFTLLLTTFRDGPRWIEGFVWLGASFAALIWDARKIIDAKHPKPKKDVLYIGEEDDHVQTSKLDLHVRK